MELELRGITKRFGAVVANDGIDLHIRPGQIHALLGENGAGKSTLMNVLYGMHHPEAGDILIDGSPRRFRGPGDALRAGIGMVHQHFMLVPVFTVAENVMLGHEYTIGPVGHLSRGTARARVLELSDRYGLAVDPDVLVEDLPVGIQQRVEILKALLHEARVLILDEPTAVLTPQEIDDLMRVMCELRDAGTSIVFITHKLREVTAVADRITVIRRGRVVGEVGPDTSERELAGLMVGRRIELGVDRGKARPGDAILQLRSVAIDDARGRRCVDDVDLDVRAGEIVALAGVQGNGQEELVEALLGLRPVAGGEVCFDGDSLVGLSPHQILDAGVGFVPEDRQADGLIAGLSVADNLVLDLHDRPAYSRAGLLRRAAITTNAVARIAEFTIHAASSAAPAGTLSGGNQQKLVLARALSRSLRLLVASQPTRGVDVGAQQMIHQRLIAERDRGTAIVLVSTELDEVLALADRIAVMYRGRIIGVLPAGASRDEVGLMMAGVPPAQARVDAAAHPTLLSTDAAGQP